MLQEWCWKPLFFGFLLAPFYKPPLALSVSLAHHRSVKETWPFSFSQCFLTISLHPSRPQAWKRERERDRVCVRDRKRDSNGSKHSLLWELRVKQAQVWAERPPGCIRLNFLNRDVLVADMMPLSTELSFFFYQLCLVIVNVGVWLPKLFQEQSKWLIYLERYWSTNLLVCTEARGWRILEKDRCSGFCLYSIPDLRADIFEGRV